MIIKNKTYKYLFLDRDGVLNVELSGDYVKKISEFEFETNAIDALTILSSKVDLIFVVTNQRGVGRQIMTTQDLTKVHDYMLTQIENAGGKITQIYFCPDIEPKSINRKPNIGMALQAKQDYEEIDFKKSIMVGNSKSDIEFGKKLGMYTILVGNKYPKEDEIYKIADAYFENLYQFTLSL